MLSNFIHIQIQKKIDQRKSNNLDQYIIKINFLDKNAFNIVTDTNNDNLTIGIIMRLITLIKINSDKIIFKGEINV